jgi:hypothetical protein
MIGMLVGINLIICNKLKYLLKKKLANFNLDRMYDLNAPSNTTEVTLNVRIISVLVESYTKRF